MNFYFLYAIGVICLINVYSSNAYTCLDDENRPVDWFIAIKFHYINKYAYLSPTQAKWKLSDYGINKSNGFLYHTVQQVFDNNQDKQSIHVIYNDEPGYKANWNLIYRSKRKYSEKGHMKGILSFKRNSSGFLLIHSAPKFPDANSFYYPNTALKYGQSFFCSTYNYSVLGDIASQILIGRPDVYMFHSSDAIMRDFPLVHNFKDPPIVNVKSSVKTLTTRGGINLLHFMKSAIFEDDLYNALVAPKLRQNVLVEAWRHGEGLLNSNCSLTYKTYNVKLLVFNSLDRKIITTDDHSKWLVTADRSTVCIGDINREITQFRRGGGTLCFHNSHIAGQFSEIIRQYEKCV